MNGTSSIPPIATHPCYCLSSSTRPTQSLVEGQGGDPTTGGLADWQRELISQKLGLALGGEGGADGGAESIRVYLSGVAAEAPPAMAVPAGAGVAAGSSAAVAVAGRAAGAPATSTSTSAAAVAAGPVRQPVDPQLLAALRIGTLQVGGWAGVGLCMCTCLPSTHRLDLKPAGACRLAPPGAVVFVLRFTLLP